MSEKKLSGSIIKNTVLQAVAHGGEPPYMYRWSDGQIGQQITVMSGRKYHLTITDSKGERYETWMFS